MTVRPGVVSVILPVYNRPGLLVEAVDSVFAQTYRSFEIVIVDDGSTDGTPEVAQSLAHRHPDVVRYVRRENGGSAAAMNTGLRHATGEFIQFLDSDDLVLREKFAKQVEGLRTNPECGISYCQAREYELGGAWSGLPARQTGTTFTHLFPALLSGRIWPSPAPLFRRTVVDAIGLYRSDPFQCDWEFESRAGALGVRLHHCREFLADTRGVHRLEGRAKGRAGRANLPGLAEVHELILARAREAGMSAATVAEFVSRLFRVARQCASVGLEPEARRCLDLGLGAASSPVTRGILRLYGAGSDTFGWERVGWWCQRLADSPFMRWYRAARRWPSAFGDLWRHRARVARATIAGQPVITWPQLLSSRWERRQSRQRFVP